MYYVAVIPVIKLLYSILLATLFFFFFFAKDKFYPFIFKLCEMFYFNFFIYLICIMNAMVSMMLNHKQITKTHKSYFFLLSFGPWRVLLLDPLSICFCTLNKNNSNYLDILKWLKVLNLLQTHFSM